MLMCLAPGKALVTPSQNNHYLINGHKKHVVTAKDKTILVAMSTTRGFCS